MSKLAYRIQTYSEDALNSTGFSYASFLLGEAQSANLDIVALTPGMRSQTLAFYFQDDWKVDTKLTLNLGLRGIFPPRCTKSPAGCLGLIQVSPIQALMVIRVRL